MKVYSVTDIPTPSLQHQGLVGASVRVGTHVIPAGGSAVLKGTSQERTEVTNWVRRGALSLQEPRRVAAREEPKTLRATHPTEPPPSVVIPTEPPPPVVALIEGQSEPPLSEQPYGTLIPQAVIEDVAEFSHKTGKKRRR